MPKSLSTKFVKNRKAYGKLGEDFACEVLKGKGYKIIQRNFRSKFGEIDIVAIDKETLVLVEVKTRWSKKYGCPEDAVTPQKLAKITKTSFYYNLLNPGLPKKQRIEVVALEVEGGIIQSARIIKAI